MDSVPVRIKGKPKHLIAIAAMLSILSLILIIRNFSSGNDIHIVQFDVCETKELPQQPLRVFPTDVKRLYICGVVEGEGYETVSYDLFHNDQVPFSISKRLEAGTFYISIPPTGNRGRYAPGQYRLAAYYERYPVFEVEFEVQP